MVESIVYFELFYELIHHIVFDQSRLENFLYRTHKTSLFMLTHEYVSKFARSDTFSKMKISYSQTLCWLLLFPRLEYI